MFICKALVAAILLSKLFHPSAWAIFNEPKHAGTFWNISLSKLVQMAERKNRPDLINLYQQLIERGYSDTDSVVQAIESGDIEPTL